MRCDESKPKAYLFRGLLPFTVTTEVRMNILSLIENQLSPQTIAPISNAIGETPEATKSALGAAVPGLLGSLLGKVSASPNGVTDIFNMLKQGSSQGAWTENAGNLAQGMSNGELPAAHQSLLSSLLGSKLGPVSDFISGHAGVRPRSATSLLGMAAPLLMGTLSKQVSSQGLGAAGLGQLLSSQIPHLKEALPSGLTNTLGINNVLTGTQKIAQPVEAAARQAMPKAAPAGGTALKWVAAAVALALIGWFIASHSHPATQVGGTSESNLNSVAMGHGQQPDMSGLNLAPGGIGDSLSKAISSSDWNKPIELPGVTTDSAGVLTDSARAGVREIHQVLAAYPSTKVQITAFGATDDSGLNQANSIKNALVAEGISEDRITTRGQTGSGNPTLKLAQ